MHVFQSLQPGCSWLADQKGASCGFIWNRQHRFCPIYKGAIGRNVRGNNEVRNARSRMDLFWGVDTSGIDRKVYERTGGTPPNMGWTWWSRLIKVGTSGTPKEGIEITCTSYHVKLFNSLQCQPRRPQSQERHSCLSSRDYRRLIWHRHPKLQHSTHCILARLELSFFATSPSHILSFNSAFSLLNPPTIVPDSLSDPRRRWDILRITFESTVYTSPPSSTESLSETLRTSLMESSHALATYLDIPPVPGFVHTFQRESFEDSSQCCLSPISSSLHPSVLHIEG